MGASVISGWARSSGAGTGLTTFYRWIDGQLTCVRRIEVLPAQIFPAVKIRVNGPGAPVALRVFGEHLSGAGTGLTTFYRWIDGQLTCVRRIEAELNAESEYTTLLRTRSPPCFW